METENSIENLPEKQEETQVEIVENNEVTEQPDGEKSEGKSSRWIGIVLIAAFVIMGGLSGGSAWMWVIFVILVLITLAGESKWTQLALGVVLMVFFLPDSDDSSSHSSSSSYSNEYSSGSSSSGQSASEKAVIERMFNQIEGLKRSYDDAVKYNLPDERQKQLSDEAWKLYNKLNEMNLTHEQRVRLSNMFAL